MFLLFALAAVAEPAADPGVLWNACLIENARRLSAQPEPAATIADAAMAQCANREAPVREQMFFMQMRAYTHVAQSKESLVALSENATRDSFNELRANLRGKLLVMVMEERAAPPAAK